MAILRHKLETLRGDRRGCLNRDDREDGVISYHNAEQRVKNLYARMRAIAERFDHWETKLVADEHTIRPPLELWDLWTELSDEAEVYWVELNTLSDALDELSPQSYN